MGEATPVRPRLATIQEVSASKEWDDGKETPEVIELKKISTSTLNRKATPRPKEPYVMSPVKESDLKPAKKRVSRKSKSKSPVKKRDGSPKKRRESKKAQK